MEFQHYLAGLSAESRFMTEVYARRHPEEVPPERSSQAPQRPPGRPGEPPGYPQSWRDLDALSGRVPPEKRSVMGMDYFVENDPDLVRADGEYRYE